MPSKFELIAYYDASYTSPFLTKISSPIVCFHPYFDTTTNSHNNLNPKTIEEVCISLYFTKNWTKMTTKFRVLLKKIKTINKICVISKIKFVVFYYKVPITPPTLAKTMCLKIPFLLLKTFLFEQSWVTSSWFQKQ